ncbi:hypothetical protein N474_20360 [Pseudoalteromonas luteoviolacea CPMOR-2]|uniref:DUF6817 domain-containing protein n=1 Tax=Pseudoalteromonas luteoviolacea DSM 6061 TaxID=1365250 RepID=A0A166YXZ9_9GAMM|nr:hypothetical protein [Pseudoalteromonas luteoviolacea]KZN43617.1 hypothetical protein N475_08590 [Pseudoalteromonas luteoviolacea DSM 6061]KZN53688.1 hypothetical protein N474_20360 [Pseudoalteromonas luteoviolacea CPMOR-2]MBE0386500.1 hypothetical protein [Pseudoalteromonas luteoviolacea DSM 6061]
MDKFKVLQEIGAGDFQHLNGTLQSHLIGTERILKEWGSSKLLQVAGLFHAAYGTDGFDESMVALAQRNRIAELIGKEEEALVYLYCACNRDFVFAQFGRTDSIQFKNRFTQHIFPLGKSDTKLLCELTAANELELVKRSPSFKSRHGVGLLDLFKRMAPYLSSNAHKAYSMALADVDIRCLEV